MICWRHFSSFAPFALAVVAACTPPEQAPAAAPTKAGGPPEAVEATGRITSLERDLPGRMAHYQVPGVSVAIIDHYDIAFAKAWGVLDKDLGVSATPESLFHASSISMVLNAMATLTLVEGGTLSLDEDVNEKLSSWKVPVGQETAAQKPTIRRILSHTAGFNVNGFGRGYAVGGRVPTLRQVLNGENPAINEPIRVIRVPGSKLEFSAGGITVLQQLLVDVTETNYEKFMRETVLAPIGMTHSTFEQPTAAIAIDLAASGHDKNGEVVNGWTRSYPTEAACGLWTTASDLARLVIELEKSAGGTSNKVLTQKTVQELMLTPSDSALGNVGLGLFLTKKNGHIGFYHRGTHIGFSGYIIGYPDLGTGAVILTNGEQGTALFQEVLDRIAADYHWPT